jgi:hypothetical protein
LIFAWQKESELLWLIVVAVVWGIPLTAISLLIGPAFVSRKYRRYIEAVLFDRPAPIVAVSEGVGVTSTTKAEHPPAPIRASFNGVAPEAVTIG